MASDAGSDAATLQARRRHTSLDRPPTKIDRCDENRDVGTPSLFETWIDEGQRRAWFLVRNDSGLGKRPASFDGRQKVLEPIRPIVAPAIYEKGRRAIHSRTNPATKIHIDVSSVSPVRQSLLE